MMYSDFDDVLYDLRNTFNAMQDIIDESKKTINEWNKDEEIQKAQNEAKYWREHSLCHLSDKELERLSKFQEKHYKKCAEPLNNKRAGNTYIYELTGTGIGTIIKVTCPICRGSEDITDTSSW